MKRHNEVPKMNGSPYLAKKENFYVDWIQKM